MPLLIKTTKINIAKCRLFHNKLDFLGGGGATSKHNNVKCTRDLRNVLIQTNWAKVNAGVNYLAVAHPAPKSGCQK